jgi:hypothetical protein
VNPEKPSDFNRLICRKTGEVPFGIRDGFHMYVWRDYQELRVFAPFGGMYGSSEPNLIGEYFFRLS